MKTKNTAIYILLAFWTLAFTACKNEEVPGPAGQDGLDGQNATVYYSEWFTPSEWLGTSGDWYFSVDAPDLTEDIVENGIILAYVSLDGDVYANAMRPLPAYAVGANWSFLIPDYKIIEFTSDMISMPLTTGNLFRFIAIPGTIPALKSTMLKIKSEEELRSMTYTEVCKLFNIQE